MKKVFVTVATVGVVGLGSTLIGNPVHADEISDIQDQREDIKDDLSDADSEIADVVIDLEEINDEIERVEDTLDENKKEKEDTEEEIETTNDEIDELEDEIEKLENDIEERFEILKDRAVSYQQNGGDAGFMEVVFDSENFTDMVSRASAVSKITNSDEELLEKQEEDKAKVDENKDKAEEQLAELKDMKDELDGIQDTIMAQKEEKKENKKTLKKKEKKLDEKKEDLEVEDSELASLESDVRESIEAAEEEQQSEAEEDSSDNDSSSDGDLKTLSDGDGDGDGEFAWPVDGGYISSKMTMRWGKKHNGIDIARPDSRTITASDGGVVKETENSGDGYGNKVVIDHGDGMETLYAHLNSIDVSVNDKVDKGQSIGEMGSTGSATGVHLHFEVHDNGDIKDPENYVGQ